MTLKQIDAALEEGLSLKTIAQAYSEIANLKIKRIRAEVERNRIFFKEIEGVYNLIKRLSARKKINIVKPEQTISIVLTSNYRFYGSINSDLLEYYVAQTQKIETAHIFLGKAAIDYFRAQPIFKNSQEVMLKGDQPNADELNSLASLLSHYNQVLVFYSSMKSLMTQVPTVLDITSSSSSPAHLEGEGQMSPGIHPKFIFEPELPKILQFFDSQIITLLLEGAFLESELSRTASRFISMDQAETEANKFIKQYQTLKSYVKRNQDNNAILENFATMMAVKGGNRQ